MTDELKLKKIGARERKAIELATSTNRRARENWEAIQARRRGPAACSWCGAEPCGAQWTRPGDVEPGGERCCEHCSHEAVDGWTHTHTAFSEAQSFPVCALVMKEGEVVYLRRDGVVQLVELHTPKPGSELGGEDLEDVPSVAFLGRDERKLGLYFAGEGGDRSINLWDNRVELDPLWLQIRLQAAVSKDEARKERRRAERKALEDAHDKRVAEMMAEDERKRNASIERRQLQHETRIVMDEVVVDADADVSELGSDLEVEAELDENDVSEEAVEMPAASEVAAPIDLKAPAPVKKGPGRPKRSERQRRARERQKRAWARQEAKNRLEVKRLARVARTEARTDDETLVKEEK
jgi:hypothetical protein